MIDPENHNSAGGAVPDPSQAVDLGLPSGTKWAPWNVGANRPAEIGGYFAWGETTADKGDYSWNNYKFLENTDDKLQRISKYQNHGDCTFGLYYVSNSRVGDGKTTLDPEDDAATANWGRRWEMPAAEQFRELLDRKNCTWEWKQRDDGTVGFVITSVRNGNSLFLPAAGYFYEVGLYVAGVAGHYWSSDLKDGLIPKRAFYLDFSQGIRFVSDCERCYGMSVRPVIATAKVRPTQPSTLRFRTLLPRS